MASQISCSSISSMKRIRNTVRWLSDRVSSADRDLLRPLLRQHARLRRTLAARQQPRHFAQVGSRLLHPAPELELAGSLLVADQVDSDARKPGVDGAIAAEGGTSVVGLQQAVLHDAVREILVADGVDDEPQQPSAVDAIESLDVVNSVKAVCPVTQQIISGLRASCIQS